VAKQLQPHNAASVGFVIVWFGGGRSTMPDGVRVQAHGKENDADSIREGLPAKRASTAPVTSRLPGRGTTYSVGQFKAKPTVLPFFVIAVVVQLCVIPAATLAAPLSQAEFATLASRCAPSVSTDTVKAVAETESGLDPYALHDNTTGVIEKPSNQDQAFDDARAWIDRGDSVDVGLMQINSRNFSALGLTARTALDPCTSMAGGAAVLQAAYGGGKTSADQQAALLMALSRYNTGTPFRGIMNGYARAVMANDSAQPLTAPSGADDAVEIDPNAPPSWNIWATASYVQSHGAPWLVPLGPSLNPEKMPVGHPAPAAVDDTRVANNQANLSTQPTMRTQ
jgi:type IV secretion system protein VirB1